MTRKYDKGDQPSGGETTWTNTGATRYGRGQHKTGQSYRKLVICTVQARQSELGVSPVSDLGRCHVPLISCGRGLTIHGLTRAVANGPVGLAMAGPIIEPAIKKNTNFFNFLIFIFWLGLIGIINETVFF